MASVDVKVTNKSGRTVGLRLPSDSKMLAYIRKRVKADDLEGVEVSPTPQPDEAASQEAGDEDVEPDAEGAEVSDDAPVDLAELRAEYTELAGQKPDHRWKAPRLQQEIDALLADDEE